MKPHIPPVCWVRRSYLRWRIHIPYWRDDRVAKMLGIADKGCPRCGHGSVAEERP